MAEIRKIVLILGNGFDLDLGLKTSYKDFWESEYCPKDYPAPLIYHLNQQWPNNLEAVKWYDLENELLNYYKSLSDPTRGADIITGEEKDFLKDFSSYGFACGWYSDKVELMQSLVDKGVLLYRQDPLPRMLEHYREDALKSPIWRDRKALGLIKEGLCNYLKSIEKPIPESLSVAYHLLLAMTKCVEAGNTISVYTFNYTRIQFLGNSIDDIPVHYMHGSCEDDKIIVGTRDGTYMVPEYDFLQKVMDDSFTPPDIVSALKNTDEVVIFGHSLGENDRQYFEQFFTHQASSDNLAKTDIVIFTRDTNSKADIKRALQSIIGGNLSTLYSVNHPYIIRTGELHKDQKAFYNFLVGHHTDKHFAEEIVGKLIQSSEA